jgi:hypothetical protein
MCDAPRPGEGKLAALRRFPGKAGLIEELVARSENFRDMCDELADVESALLAIKDLPAKLRKEREAECAGWIERLTGEIEVELGNANVLPLSRTPRGGIL